MELSDLSAKQRGMIDQKDRKVFGKACQTYEEAEAGAFVKLEKELHNQYIGFLNRSELDYFHAPMNKRSTLPEGHPDFSVYRDSMIMFLEFKVGNNKLSEVQAKRIEQLNLRGNVVIVAYGYDAAVYQTRRFFDL